MNEWEEYRKLIEERWEIQRAYARTVTEAERLKQRIAQLNDSVPAAYERAERAHKARKDLI